MRTGMQAAVLAAAVVLVGGGRAWAWGKEGHEVVGRIADEHLSKKAKAAIKELLTEHQFTSLSDGRLTNWADSIRSSAQYKRQYPQMAKWHYIDYDVDKPADGFKPGDSGPDKDDAVGALKKFAAVLKNPKADLEDRRHALFFIAHILSDLHQPLHCADRDDDKGGNLVKVSVGDGDTNLHWVWDTDLVKKAMGSLNETDYAARLVNRLTDDKRKEYQKGKLEEWVLDGHKLARKVVYADEGKELKKANALHTLSEAYKTAGAEVVAEQMTKGGVRLAQFLNDLFAE